MQLRFPLLTSPISTLWLAPLGVSATLGFGPAAQAQEEMADMAPAAEQSRFHKLLGNWEGSGQVKMSPDAPSGKWTAIATVRSVLGGHFVREDLRIDFGADAPAPLAIRTFYGYSKETKKWMAYSINNMGAADAVEVHWDAGKMLVGKTGTAEGKLFVERFCTTFRDDSYSIASYQAVGNGKPYTHVSGSFKRTKVANAASGKPNIPAFAPAAKQMSKLDKWAGTYRVKGWMIMSPEIPKMDIAATEIMRPIFGGTILEVTLHGDPVPNFGGYEARGAFAWSPLDNCYKTITVDSMGGASIQNANWSGSSLVVGGSRTEGGIPVTTQTVVECGPDGSPKSVREHKIAGSHKPLHSFQGSYTKKQDLP